MKTEILTLLRETDGYVSGQELCENLVSHGRQSGKQLIS